MLTQDQLAAATGLFKRMNERNSDTGDEDAMFVLFGALLADAKQRRDEYMSPEHIERLAIRIKGIVGAMWPIEYCREITRRMVEL